jgi:hypothetical protein
MMRGDNICRRRRGRRSMWRRARCRILGILLDTHQPTHIGLSPRIRFRWANRCFSDPTVSRAPAPTSIHPGARPERHMQMSKGPTGSRAPAPTAAPPGAHSAAKCTRQPQRIPRAAVLRAQLATSRCPLPAAKHTRPPVPRAIVLPHPLQQLQVSALSNDYTPYCPWNEWTLCPRGCVWALGGVAVGAPLHVGQSDTVSRLIFLP